MKFRGILRLPASLFHHCQRIFGLQKVHDRITWFIEDLYMICFSLALLVEVYVVIYIKCYNYRWSNMEKLDWFNFALFPHQTVRQIWVNVDTNKSKFMRVFFLPLKSPAVKETNVDSEAWFRLNNFFFSTWGLLALVQESRIGASFYGNLAIFLR